MVTRKGGGVQLLESGRASMPAKSARAALCCAGWRPRHAGGQLTGYPPLAGAHGAGSCAAAMIWRSLRAADASCISNETLAHGLSETSDLLQEADARLSGKPLHIDEHNIRRRDWTGSI
eukprot:6189368-Pleurochrysis_carterae.AAC.2